MKASAIVCGVAIAATFLSGCAQRYADTPSPTRFEASKQLKLQSVGHWRVLAGDFAAQISEDLRQKGVNQPLYVPVVSNDFPFVEGFQELLSTALLAQGWELKNSPRNALTVDVRYFVYKAASKEHLNLAVVETANQEGYVVEQYTKPPIPQSEVLVTATVTDGDRVLARRSNVYFATDADAGLYGTKAGVATDIKVRGQ